MQSPPSFLRRRLDYPFPPSDPHSGIPLSNGGFGAVLWGSGRNLRLTVNLPAPDAEPLLPLGRLDLLLPRDWALDSGGLHMLNGEAEIDLASARSEAARAKVRGCVLREPCALCLRVTGLDGAEVPVRSRPPDSAETLAAYHSAGFARPQVFDAEELGGWLIERPGDSALCTAWLRHPAANGLLLYVASARAATPQDARRQALLAVETASAEGYTPATLRTFAWWRRWWDHALRGEGVEGGCLLELLRGFAEGGRSQPTMESGAADPGGDWSGAELRVITLGQVEALLAESTMHAGALRPPFLEGPALGGHLPEPRRPGAPGPAR